MSREGILDHACQVHLPSGRDSPEGSEGGRDEPEILENYCILQLLGKSSNVQDERARTCVPPPERGPILIVIRNLPENWCVTERAEL